MLAKHIEKSEFEVLSEHLQSEDDVEFVRRHYRLDENHRPARFELTSSNGEDVSRVESKLTSLLKVLHFLNKIDANATFNTDIF